MERVTVASGGGGIDGVCGGGDADQESRERSKRIVAPLHSLTRLIPPHVRITRASPSMDMLEELVGMGRWVGAGEQESE